MPPDPNPQSGTEQNQGDKGSQPAPEPAAPEPAAPAPTPDPKPTPDLVPAENLRAVAAERDAAQKALRQRDEKDKEKQGEWETLAKTREQERDSAIERAQNAVVRSSFVSAIAKEVVDPLAAFVLARDSGLLRDVKVTDDYEPDDKAITKAVEEALKKFPFLKTGSKSFGDPRDGSEPHPGIDPSKASGRDLLKHGYDTASTTRRQS